MARAILNKWHPQTKKITYWFPTLFILGLVIAIGLCVIGFKILLNFYLLYFLACFILSWSDSHNFKVALLSVVAVCIQFYGYGYGFLKSNLILMISNKNEESLFPHLFFKKRV